MTTFTLTINTDNAAFEDDMPAEVARILRAVARYVGNGALDIGDSRPVRDANGNTVGRWEVEG